MERDDLGAQEFAQRLTGAGLDRARLVRSYRRWVLNGARAQGCWSAGWVVAGLSAFLAVDGWIAGFRSPLLLAGCAVGIAVGIGLARVAARREREWRRANPWSGPEEVG